MADASIPVDLFNPGQVFACLGFLEAADVVLGDAEGGFDWSNNADTRFRLRANGLENPFENVLAFLAEANLESVAPAGSDLSTESWNVPTRALADVDAFPFPEPDSPATLPAVLGRKDGPPTHVLTVDHWGDATKRDNVKFWAGAGGYPGVALFRDALDLSRSAFASSAADPFAFRAPQKSSFRLDWRRDYIPLEVGFSPNRHSSITMMGYPIVELLATIGLSHARPRRFTKLEYGYGVLGGLTAAQLFDPCLLRAALGQAEMPFARRIFRFQLGWPGQENQARCILEVTEEIAP